MTDDREMERMIRRAMISSLPVQYREAHRELYRRNDRVFAACQHGADRALMERIMPPRKPPRIWVDAPVFQMLLWSKQCSPADWAFR